MSQDQAKVFHGPFDVSFNSADVPTVAKAYSASNKASVEINLTTAVVTEELVDGSKIYDEAGRTVEVTINLDEVVAADMDLIEGINSGASPEITIQFTNMPAGTDTLRIPSSSGAALGLKAFANIVGGKAQIKVMYGAPVGTTLANMFDIA